jgi:hypothetical protein
MMGDVTKASRRKRIEEEESGREVFFDHAPKSLSQRVSVSLVRILGVVFVLFGIIPFIMPFIYFESHAGRACVERKISISKRKWHK